MNVKEIWRDSDFEQMGWHDCRIHAISFPDEDLIFSLDIDYIFKWVLDDADGLYKFWVSPCVLLFYNVLRLEIDIDFRNAIGLDIKDIKRRNPRLSPNEKLTIWDFEITTDKGFVKFECSGYKQIIKKQPLFSQSQVIVREKF